MRAQLVIASLAAVVAALGCMNLPSKFDAKITNDIRRHIEEQAVSTLDYIEGRSDTLPPPEPAPPPSPPPSKTSWGEKLWQIVDPMPTACAAESRNGAEEFNKIAGRLRERNPRIQELKASHAVGEDNRGYVALRAGDKDLGSEKRNEAQRLISAENRDRKDLYQEVARLNKDRDLSVSAVERIYAAERLKRAKTGDLVQLPGKGSDFDAFSTSDRGKTLGAACEPEAWVQVK